MTNRSLFTAYALAVAALCACSAQVEVEAQETRPDRIAGVASVIDGDTIEIHGQRIRLSGFDTPERGARCGSVNVYKKAAFVLSDFIGDQTVFCDVKDTDRWGRLVASCSAGGADLGDHMVRQGWGRDWARYSNRRYADEEAQSRSEGSGLWGLDCPEDLWKGRSYD